MGQAKLRGTKEQRIAEGIKKKEELLEKQEQDRIERNKKYDKYFNKLPTATKNKIRTRQTIVGLACASLAYFPGIGLVHSLSSSDNNKKLS